MERWKWLYPGMRVKRWLFLMIVGTFLIGLGITILFNTQLLTAAEGKMLWFVSTYIQFADWAAGFLIIILGIFTVGLGMRLTIRSLVGALSPADVSNLAEVVYRKRSLQKGPHIVVIGGGTGLSTLLRGLKDYSSNITAIVTVADDGGSSGRIREQLGILPPGDVRNTLVALADTEPLMEKLFQYRFSWGEGLSGHSFGNLFIAAMTDITGDFEIAIREFSKVLAVRGRVIPSTLDAVTLKAKYTDGTEMSGESKIPQEGKRIKRITLEPVDAEALPEALEILETADLVVLGPGSLYTSLIPNLLVRPISEALATTKAPRIYVCNVMTQPGETDGMNASDHISAILQHTGGAMIMDYVLVNSARISGEQARKYQEQNAHAVRYDLDGLRKLGVTPIARPLLGRFNLVRHDSHVLAREIMKQAFKAQGISGRGKSITLRFKGDK